MTQGEGLLDPTMCQEILILISGKGFPAVARIIIDNVRNQVSIWFFLCGQTIHPPLIICTSQSDLSLAVLL